MNINRKFSLIASCLTLTTSLLFGILQKAEAATCTFPTNVTVLPGEGKFVNHQATGFAYAMYYLEFKTSGNLGLIGFNFEALPGFRKDQRRGFIGTSANLYTTFFVNPRASSGQRTTVTERIYDVSGRTVCQGSFTVTAQ
jgi:hypothetical protein